MWHSDTTEAVCHFGSFIFIPRHNISFEPIGRRTTSKRFHESRIDGIGTFRRATTLELYHLTLIQRHYLVNLIYSTSYYFVYFICSSSRTRQEAVSVFLPKESDYKTK